MNINEFRTKILDAIREAKAREPSAHIHLLYAPELADPLELASDAQRSTALISPLRKVKWNNVTAPRLITFNSRLNGAEALEKYETTDDPLLEHSISQSYANLFLGEHIQAALTNDDPGMAENSICGWIVSTDSASQIAAKIMSISTVGGAQPSAKMDRWFYPHCVAGLWPVLADRQKRDLLGSGTWLAHEHFGILRKYRAARTAAQDSREVHPVPRFDSVQRRIIDNSLVVSALVNSWQTICFSQKHTLPEDAVSKLHHYVHQAQRHHLDAENLMIYVMTAVQLSEGALATPEFTEMLALVSKDGLPLRDALSALPDSFWQRHHPTKSIPA